MSPSLEALGARDPIVMPLFYSRCSASRPEQVITTVLSMLYHNHERLEIE